MSYTLKLHNCSVDFCNDFCWIVGLKKDINDESKCGHITNQANDDPKPIPMNIGMLSMPKSMGCGCCEEISHQLRSGCHVA